VRALTGCVRSPFLSLRNSWEAFGSRPVAVDFFSYDNRSGWQRAKREDVTEAGYRDHLSSGPVNLGDAVAAEAVACVHLVF
jgi:hypothetical protein